jgi:acyl-homoserine-lactone acylase
VDWDAWGIPHVYGGDASDLAFGLGWAEMTNHADLLLRLYGQARGRAAEYWGADQLESDRWVHTMSIPERADVWLAAQEPEERAVIEAFAAGINTYASRYPERIDADVRRVLPVQPRDVLAHVQRLLHFNFVADAREIMSQLKGPAKGSNGWAIAPSRTASGHAQLLANPHLPWGDLFTLMEVQLSGRDLDIYGTTFVGLPFVAIGFNDRMGWTHTVNTFDGADLFLLDADGESYRWDGGRRPFSVRTDHLHVRRPDGTFEDVALVVASSVHGPIIHREGGHAIALSVTGLGAPHLIRQYLAMARARSVAEFEAALAQLQLPMFNVIYADRDGHILEVFNAEMPRRRQGDAAYWQGIVPGTTSATLWQGTHPYADLPRSLDPPSGWVQNANDSPWTMTLPPLDPKRFPPYFSATDMSFRAQRSIEMIEAASKLTFEGLVEAKFSTKVELAGRVLDELLALSRGGDATVRRAGQVLERWDRSTDATSRGGVLFEAWARLYFGEEPFTSQALAHPWSADAPLTTPAGLADPKRAVASLEQAAEMVTRRYGALDVPWGMAHRVRWARQDIEANGAPDELGGFRTAWYVPGKDGTLEQSGGDTFIAAIEFDDPVRAEAVLAYGNASQHGSPHNTDQLPLYAQKRLRTIWRTRADVMQHLEIREPLTAFEGR